MKKIMLILVAFLVLVYAGLSIFSSDKEHEAEKLLYRAMKSGAEIAKNPDVVPPRVLASIEKDLTTLVEKYPDTKVAGTGALALSEFYLNNEKYDRSLEVADMVLEKYKVDDAVSSKAQFMKGLAYEKKGDWPKALIELTKLRDEYLFTHLGIQAPLYIYDHYRASGEKAAAKNAFDQAIKFYSDMEKQYTAKNLGYIAATLKLQVYLMAGDFEGAAKTIEDTLKAYPSVLSYNQLLPQVDFVFIQKLKQPERAVAVYRSVKESIRDEKGIEALQKKIERIRESASKQ